MGQKVSFYLILLLAHSNSQTDECEASLFAISIEDSHQSVFENANVAKVTHVLPIILKIRKIINSECQKSRKIVQFTCKRNWRWIWTWCGRAMPTDDKTNICTDWKKRCKHYLFTRVACAEANQFCLMYSTFWLHKYVFVFIDQIERFWLTESQWHNELEFNER